MADNNDKSSIRAGRGDACEGDALKNAIELETDFLLSQYYDEYLFNDDMLNVSLNIDLKLLNTILYPTVTGIRVPFYKKMSSSSSLDRDYLSVCRDYGSGRDLLVAIAGDSHACRVYPHIKGLISNSDTGFILHPENFAVGGARAHLYTATQEFRNLIDSPAEIIIMWISSNDFDSIRPSNISESRYRFDLINSIIKIFKLLTERGKIVYIIGIPIRYTTRNSCKEWLQRRVRAANLRLTSHLRNRFIQLDSSYRAIESFASERFKGQHRNEMVHFIPRMYQMLSYDLVRHISEDLRSRQSIPCKFWHKLRNEY